jgi:hypothetical protein
LRYSRWSQTFTADRLRELSCPMRGFRAALVAAFLFLGERELDLLQQPVALQL